VTTHFQPTSARSAFPCWDEPNYKARFKIGAVRQRNYVALSNMPLDNTEDVSIFWGSGLVIYLLYFAYNVKMKRK
jgi:glutamyl aminopeptidase